MKRWPLALLFAALAGALLLRESGDAASSRSSLKLVFEVRRLIHEQYVEPVDSTAVIDAAIDGLMAALPMGQNVYVSPTDMQEMAGDRSRGRQHLDNREQIALLDEVLRRVQSLYVSPVTADTLSRGLVWGMLAALDPHSSYLDESDYADMAERFRGDFEGIGIYFEVRRGRLLVISPIVGSPSYGKLRAGDQIVAIEGITTEGITDEQVMKKLRGPKGSQVTVAVVRQGRPEPFDVAIRRDRIEIRSVPYVYELRPGLGYVRIARFAETTGEELGEALRGLRARGVDRLLLDLRGNGGGLLSQAVEVADHFLETGQLVVYTEGRDPGSRREYAAQRSLERPPLSIVVLIDHGSASASEIVAGAIQDHDAGLVAGQTSFGKGLVQEQFPLSANGGLLLLTVARYYTPLGRLIQRPYGSDLQAYYQEGVDDFDPNAVDSLRAGKQVFRTASGRAVYGGGGITPDVVLDQDPFPDVVYELYGSGVLGDFASRWIGAHSIWPSRDFDDFASRYEASAAVVDSLMRSAAEAGVRLPADVPEVDLQTVARELKAGFAQVLWGDEERYRIHVTEDAQVKAALELFPQARALSRGSTDGY